MGIIFIKDILKTVRQKGERLTIVGKRDIFPLCVNQKQIKAAQIENLKEHFSKH